MIRGKNAERAPAQAMTYWNLRLHLRVQQSARAPQNTNGLLDLVTGTPGRRGGQKYFNSTRGCENIKWREGLSSGRPQLMEQRRGRWEGVVDPPLAGFGYNHVTCFHQ